jgi:predicted enzyme related to lactoylglutathione lyase
MTETGVKVAPKPVWVDLSSSDAEGSRTFYSQLFGWTADVNPDPQYGGYSIATLDGNAVAGIGPRQDENAVSAWAVYIGSDDVEELGRRVSAAGGGVVASFEIPGQGKMAVCRDSAGAFICGWQPGNMQGFGTTGAPGTFAWAELAARGLNGALDFYRTAFGWTTKQSEMPEGAPPYVEFQLNGESIAGAMEMMPEVPEFVPSYWMPYFGSADVDATHRRALELGAQEMAAPMDFPGGRFSIVRDPQGAMFGIVSIRS